jgi:hypothetical protein
MGWPVTVATLPDAMVHDKLEWLGEHARGEALRRGGMRGPSLAP